MAVEGYNYKTVTLRGHVTISNTNFYIAVTTTLPSFQYPTSSTTIKSISGSSNTQTVTASFDPIASIYSSNSWTEIGRGGWMTAELTSIDVRTTQTKTTGTSYQTRKSTSGTNYGTTTTNDTYTSSSWK